MKKLLLILSIACIPPQTWASNDLYEEIETPTKAPEKRVVNVPFTSTYQDKTMGFPMSIIDLIDLKKIEVPSPREFVIPTGFPLELMFYLNNRVNAIPTKTLSKEECSLTLINPKTKEKIGTSKLLARPDTIAGQIIEAQRQIFEFHRQSIGKQLAPFMQYIFEGGEATETLLGDACGVLTALQRAYDGKCLGFTENDSGYLSISVANKKLNYMGSKLWRKKHPSDKKLRGYINYFIGECFLPFIMGPLAGTYSDESGLHATSLHAGSSTPIFWLIDQPIPATLKERKIIAFKIAQSTPYFKTLTKKELFGDKVEKH